MTYAVRVNEMKMTGPGDGLDCWRQVSWQYSNVNRLKVIYPTRFGRIIDIPCASRLDADQTLAYLIDLGITAKAMHLISDREQVIK